MKKNEKKELGEGGTRLPLASSATGYVDMFIFKIIGYDT